MYHSLGTYSHRRAQPGLMKPAQPPPKTALQIYIYSLVLDRIKTSKNDEFLAMFFYIKQTLKNSPTTIYTCHGQETKIHCIKLDTVAIYSFTLLPCEKETNICIATTVQQIQHRTEAILFRKSKYLLTTFVYTALWRRRTKKSKSPQHIIKPSIDVPNNHKQCIGDTSGKLKMV